MLLARMLKERPTELRADLQMHYGLNLDEMGEKFSSFHAGACAACLPLGSRTLASYAAEAQWTNVDYKLHKIIQLLSGKDIPYPWDEESESWKESADVERFDTKAVTIEQFKDIYNNTEWRPDGRIDRI